MQGGPGGRSNRTDGVSELRAELDRLRNADPFTVLRVPPTADAERVRHAYLEATKRYHPNRFARENVELRDLAHEVFLCVRRA